METSVRDSLGLLFGCGTFIMFSCELLRVCMKGTVRGGEINGSSAFESSFWLFAVAVVAWPMRFSRGEDLLRLCLDVRLSSRGFMSGGSWAIFRKMTPR